MRDTVVTSPHVDETGSPPRLNRRQAAKVRTRQKVLDAARALFAERGYEPATIRDIAKVAGMSTGAVFANFQDKAELFDAVLAQDLANLRDTAQAAAAAENTVKGRLVAALSAGYHSTFENLPLVQAVMARSWFQPVDSELRSRETRPVLGMVTEILETGRREGEIGQDADLPLLAELIYFAYQSNYRRAAYDGWSVDKMSDQMRKQIDVVLAGALSRQ